MMLGNSTDGYVSCLRQHRVVCDQNAWELAVQTHCPDKFRKRMPARPTDGFGVEDIVEAATALIAPRIPDPASETNLGCMPVLVQNQNDQSAIVWVVLLWHIAMATAANDAPRRKHLLQTATTILSTPRPDSEIVNALLQTATVGSGAPFLSVLVQAEQQSFVTRVGRVYRAIAQPMVAKRPGGNPNVKWPHSAELCCQDIENCVEPLEHPSHVWDEHVPDVQLSKPIVSSACIAFFPDDDCDETLAATAHKLCTEYPKKVIVARSMEQLLALASEAGRILRSDESLPRRVLRFGWVKVPNRTKLCAGMLVPHDAGRLEVSSWDSDLQEFCASVYDHAVTVGDSNVDVPRSAEFGAAIQAAGDGPGASMALQGDGSGTMTVAGSTSSRSSQSVAATMGGDASISPGARSSGTASGGPGIVDVLTPSGASTPAARASSAVQIRRSALAASEVAPSGLLTVSETLSQSDQLESATVEGVSAAAILAESEDGAHGGETQAASEFESKGLTN